MIFWEDQSEAYLVSTSPFYFASIFYVHYEPSPAVNEAWEKEFTKTQDRNMDWFLNADMQVAQNIGEVMQAHSLAVANVFSEKINLKEKFGVTSFMDVGAGSGCYR